MNYAWVIDQTKCIGCHACSTACKSENDVPLGVHRTWVKAVEVGQFPNVRRHFAVLRCNHCADPPCVAICPVSAMHQRADGIVDIAHDRCIGCKACMQACPYDAIHVDPADDTVAKCHFCAHRVDRGLLPACVVICPVEALVFGDLDDPRSRVSRYLGNTPVTVRRADQGTRPKAFYVGAHNATLDPLAAGHEGAYMWSERHAGTAKDAAADVSVWSLLRAPAPTTASARRNGNRSGRRDGRARMPKARVAFDVHHLIAWKGKVSAYLWTKSIAAGAAFFAALALLLGFDADAVLVTAAPWTSAAALGVTGVLLIADLKRPERFWFILAKPQWRSWLTRGAFVIAAFGAVLAGWLVTSLLNVAAPAWLLWTCLPLAAGTAVYTAFLFAQCEARDLWQNPVLGLTLLFQMTIGGAGAMVLAGTVAPTTTRTAYFFADVLLAGLVAQLAGVVLGELTARHGSTNAQAAARVLTHGAYAPWFWGSVVFGVALPAALLIVLGPGAAAVIAAALALIGLLAYEHAFVMAGQSVPIS